MPPVWAAGSSSNTASKAWKGRLGIKAKISSKRKEECRDWDPSITGPRKKDMDEGSGEETRLGTRKLITGFLLFTHLYHHAKLQTFVTVFSLSIVVNKCLYMYSDLKWLGQGTIFQVRKQSVFFIPGCGESCKEACGTSAVSLQGALRWPWQLLPLHARQRPGDGRAPGGARRWAKCLQVALSGTEGSLTLIRMTGRSRESVPGTPSCALVYLNSVTGICWLYKLELYLCLIYSIMI